MCMDGSLSSRARLRLLKFLNICIDYSATFFREFVGDFRGCLETTTFGAGGGCRFVKRFSGVLLSVIRGYLGYEKRV